MNELPYIAGDPDYRYPAAGDEPAPAGTKCLVLTCGGICTVGHWVEGSLAWAPLPKRNREKEDRINADKRAAAAAA